MTAEPNPNFARIIEYVNSRPAEPIHYAQVRPVPRPFVRPRKWWHDLDCSGSPLGMRIITFMEWYDSRGGIA